MRLARGTRLPVVPVRPGTVRECAHDEERQEDEDAADDRRREI